MDKLIKELVKQIRQDELASGGKDGLPSNSDEVKLSEDLQQLWTLSAQYKNQSPSFDTEANFAKFKARTQAQPSQSKSKIRSLWMMRAAAAIVLLLVGVWGMNQMSSPSSELILTQNTTSEVLNMKLSDGTSVRIFPQSSLKYPESFQASDNRSVVLKGKALFDVTSNPDNPFVIQTANTRVKVLGTRFLLTESKKEKETTIAVTEGIVEFMDKASGKQIQLVADELGICREGGVLVKKALSAAEKPAEDYDLEYNMQGKSVEEVVQWLKNLSDLDIQLDKSVKDCSVSGFFTINNAFDKFEKLGFTVNKNSKGTYRISGKCQ